VCSSDLLFSKAGMFVQQIVPFLATLAWLVLWAKLTRLDFKHAFSLKPPRLSDMVICLIAACAMTVLVQFLYALLRDFGQGLGLEFSEEEKKVEQAIRGGLEPGLWAAIFLLAVLPSIVEEVIFRGAVLTGIRSRLKLLPALAFSSLLFGAVHMNVLQGAIVAILGLFFGILMVLSGSIFSAMLAHFVNNFSAIIFYHYSISLPDSPFVVVASAVALATALVLAFARMRGLALLFRLR
jgi:membrane protease YdiL (CAAX protease family)